MACRPAERTIAAGSSLVSTPPMNAASRSTGISGSPVEEAAGVALGTMREEADSLEHVRLVRFVLHSASDLQAHERVLSELE